MSNQSSPTARRILPTDLGPDLEMIKLTPGRFANAIQKNKNARHALQVIREETTSSFILNLKPDGSATVCRGWRYLFSNDGPQVHTTDHIREQLGYRGHWHQDDGSVDVHLTLDDGVCSRVGQYTQLVPNHAADWHLRGVTIVPRNHPVLRGPVLACQSVGMKVAFGEDQPHLTSGVLTGEWLLLGAGNGLRIKVVTSLRGDEEIPAVRVEYSSEPVQTNTWEQSF